MPARRPFKAFLLKSMPVKTGVKMTRAPGPIIFFKEALVEIATQRSGLEGSPCFILTNCSLISVIISLAASPTALIVMAEKAYGIIAPMIRPAKVVG